MIHKLHAFAVYVFAGLMDTFAEIAVRACVSINIQILVMIVWATGTFLRHSQVFYSRNLVSNNFKVTALSELNLLVREIKDSVGSPQSAKSATASGSCRHTRGQMPHFHWPGGGLHRRAVIQMTIPHFAFCLRVSVPLHSAAVSTSRSEDIMGCGIMFFKGMQIESVDFLKLFEEEMST